MARPLVKIFADRRLQLALARLRHVSWCRPLGLGLPFSTPLSIASVLLTATLLPGLRGPVALAGPPAIPATCRESASGAAITGERMGGKKEPFTAFEKAASLTTRPPASLQKGAKMVQWIWASGRWCSRWSSLGVKVVLASETPCSVHVDVLPLYHRSRSRDRVGAPGPGPARENGPIQKRC